MLLIRILIASLAGVEGGIKFIAPAEFGAGRFAKLGLPRPDILGPFVGATELLCGALVLMGLLTRFACVPLMAIKLLALFKAKGPLLATVGFWRMAYEARVDFAMLLAASAVVLLGAGAWSFDGWLRRSRGG